MRKTALVAACALSLSSVPAFAQSSQGKGGSDNGPSSNSATTNGTGPGEMGRANGNMNNTTGMSREGSGPSGMVGAGTGSSAPSSSGNVGPGTNNNSGKQPGGR
jgi:hypothetical protein